MAHAGILYDKHAVIQKLQKRGFSHEQAEGIAEVLADPDASALATKLACKFSRRNWRKRSTARPSG
jgi:hypothetical protein